MMMNDALLWYYATLEDQPLESYGATSSSQDGASGSHSGESTVRNPDDDDSFAMSSAEDDSPQVRTDSSCVGTRLRPSCDQSSSRNIPLDHLNSTDHELQRCPCYRMFETLFTRVSFYPTLAWGYVLSKLKKRQWYNRIDDTVVLGALPLRKSIAPVLVQTENIKGVISMVQSYETWHIPSQQEWTDLGVRDFLWLPTQDFWGAPTQGGLETALNLLDVHQKAQTSVYVHCKAGRTRSATLVMCYLIKRYNLTPADAEKLIRSRRPNVWFGKYQMLTINQFYDSLVKGGNFQPKDIVNHPDIQL